MKNYTIGLSQINNSFSGAHYLPYVAGLLEGYVKKYASVPDRYHFLVPIYKRMAVDEAVAHLLSADIAGFSLYVWNYQLSLAIMRKLKQIKPDIFIVCGGPHVPDNAETFLRNNTFVDIAIHGEGESVFLNLLENLYTADMSEVQGISFLDSESNFRINPKPPRIKNLDEIPSPYLTGVFEKLMTGYTDAEWLILWETNRGCPFRCTFCDWGSATQAKVNKFSTQRLQEELDWISEKKIEFIFCCDANFGILERDVELAEYAALNMNRFGYPHALSVQNTKNATDRAYKVQKILSDAGLNKGVTLSMQSLDETTLINIKRENISLQTYDTLQRRFTQDGVPTYSDLILGLPGETYDSFTRGISDLIASGQHNRIQFNNLAVLPNTEMGDQQYQNKYGMVLVQTKILNIHGVLDDDPANVSETQDLAVATSSMPLDDWARTRAFCWMTALLHFDKLLQIPLIMLHQISGLSYRDLIENFMNVTGDKYELLCEIRDYFIGRAKEIQAGGSEYKYSDKWLGIWWPDDEYMLIQLAVEDRISRFYEESVKLFEEKIPECSTDNGNLVLYNSVLLNRELIKLPFRAANIKITIDYNIKEVYEGALRGQNVPLERIPSTYLIDRSAETWDSWETWCRQVVWFANKKGAYLYGSKALEKYYAAHY